MTWEKVKLGELVVLRQGFAINAKSKHYIASGETEFPLLRIADMREGKKCIFLEPSIPERFLASPTDIIYTRTGNVGMVFKNQFGVVHNNCFTVNAIDPNVLSQDFLYFALQNPEVVEVANILATGAAQPDLPHGAFKSIEISLPPRDVQDKIAGILSKYDELIENSRKQIALLEEAAQRLYREWFVDLRFPGSTSHDSLPQGWRKDAAINIFPNKINIGKTPARQHSEYFSLNREGNIIWASVADLNKSSVFVHDSSEYITPDAARISNIKIIPKNAILVSFKLTVGKTAIATHEMTSNEAIAHFVVSDVEREYMYLYLTNFQYSNLGSTSSIGTAVNSKIIKAMPIIYPTVELLEKFHQITYPIFEEIRNLGENISSLVSARDKLLPKLMSGELKV